MKILLIDNYDSFTYNLYHYLSALNCKVDVYRNNEINLNKIKKNLYQKIVISPGPGRPDQAGLCIKIVKSFYRQAFVQEYLVVLLVLIFDLLCQLAHRVQIVLFSLNIILLILLFYFLSTAN